MLQLVLVLVLVLSFVMDTTITTAGITHVTQSFRLPLDPSSSVEFYFGSIRDQCTACASSVIQLFALASLAACEHVIGESLDV